MENGVNFAIPWEVQESKSFQLQGPLTPTRGSALDPAGGSAPRPRLGKLVLRFEEFCFKMPKCLALLGPPTPWKLQDTSKCVNTHVNFRKKVAMVIESKMDKALFTENHSRQNAHFYGVAANRG